MTHRMGADSPMAPYAAQFGAALSRAMAERQVGQGVVSTAAGVSRASIVEFRHGRNLPTLPVAQRLAESLRWPDLERIVREGRTRHCRVCGVAFIQDTGRTRRICTVSCRVIAAAMDDGGGRIDGTSEGLNLLRGEVLRVGPARKQVIGKAATLIETAKGPEIAAGAALVTHREAVAAFCRSCSGDYCSTPECELRPVSPLPLVDDRATVETATKPAGRWGRATGVGPRPGEREQLSESLRRTHAERPEWRRGTSELTRQRWAAMTPEERSETMSRYRRGEKATA